MQARSGYCGMTEENADSFVLARLGLALFAFLLGLPLLLWFCWLRETPIFWRNEGGYPVWLRAVVLDTYYPILFLNVFLMFLYVFLLLRAPPRSQRSLRLNLAVLALMAAAIGFAVICTVADNIFLFFS